VAEELDLGKSSALPLQEADEKAGEPSVGEHMSEHDHKKLDDMAMRMAKRAENRINANVGKISGSTIFSK